MFTLVNMESSVAAYKQIENQVRFAIAAGQFKEGDPLPSVREAASGAGVNANTVTKAYRDLELMNIIVTRRGVGVMVAPGAFAICRDFIHDQMAKKIHEATREATAAGLSLSTILQVTKKSASLVCGPYEAAPDCLFEIVAN